MKLHERDGELGLLRELYEGCVAGKGALVIVNGPVGCGKTTLVRALSEQVTAREGTFLSVTGAASESLDRLGLIDQLVTAMRATGPADGPPAADELAKAAEAGGRVPRALMQRIHRSVAELAGRGPLVLHADDVHFADEASLQCLRYLVRRIDALPVLVVLTETAGHDRTLATLHAETLHLPHCRRLRIGPLGADGVAALLAGHPAARAAAPETVELWARTSGGNPLLLEALIEDTATCGTPEAVRRGAPMPHEAFRNAFLRCLHRGEPTLLAVARAAAVLGESVTPALIGTLLGADATSVRWSITELRAAGLFSGAWFGHERARLTVLADIPGPDLAALRTRAAEVLRESGAPAAVVARQLLAAHDPARAAWQLDILREAAREALAAGDLAAGVDHLRHASGLCTDADQEAEVIAALAEAQWSMDPAKASRYLPQLGRMVRAGQLTGSDALVVVKQRVWRGEFAQADDLLRIIEAREGAGPEQAWDTAGYPPALNRSDPALVRLWLSFCRPGLRRATRAATRTSHTRTAGAGEPAGRAAAMSPRTFLTLAADLVEFERGRAAGRLLPGPGSVTPYADPLVALIFLIGAQRLDKAVLQAERLLDEPRTRRIPLGHALLETIRAAAALGRGDVESAGEATRTALDLVTPEAWGIAIGLPLALAIRAATEAGDIEAARAFLNVPVPMVMFGTPFALPYLHALGRFRLALHRPRAALRDFESCGELMAKWELDSPELVDWRNDAAAALIALGDRRHARERIEEHLTRLGTRPSRARGTALRHLAAVSTPRHRLRLLQEAERVLDACDDGLELRRARADAQAARHAAQAAVPASVAPPAVLWDAPSLPDREALPAPLAELTDAELRVGALAAAGRTNRDIADRLSITVSTVEQHLTKIYRKLKVRGRADLPAAITGLSEACSPNVG
ncbi:regulatory LuxR family protein [Streptomyces sp. TLI_55]|uniref:AAA family ATPase n=1 Tax=Streptomyces sp. TLI_55 TaxID=1938861 RepID=UPI000BC8532F|nr:LuxR family transcriptional regulator [Streptomyces sp. TLI_55]SNX62124.1 regulatory LuxR family protein [Streptomyces sp. TLI_55]